MYTLCLRLLICSIHSDKKNSENITFDPKDIASAINKDELLVEFISDL